MYSLKNACPALALSAALLIFPQQSKAQEETSKGGSARIVDWLKELLPNSMPKSAAPSEPKARLENGTAVNEDDDGASKPAAAERIEIVAGFEPGIEQARLHERPVLILFGASWCSWCRKLELDLTRDEADEILREWIVVKVDVDEEPERAAEYQASTLPALRVLNSNNDAVAKREGYLETDELKQWLDSHIAKADPSIQSVLYDTARLSKEDIQQLIVFLSDRSTTIRAAAVERLQSNRAASASAVVDILKDGSLAQRLCALQILATWSAPVGELDPWQPYSINETSLQPTIEWLNGLDTQTIPEESSTSQVIDAEAASNIVTRLVTGSEGDRLTALSEAQLAGKQILPAIRQRLIQTELADEVRVQLRTVLYRVLAGQKLRLQNEALLTSLASLDEEMHHESAVQLLELTSGDDELLVDELSRDPSPLVREMAVQALVRLDVLRSAGRLEQLLRDSSPSVRIAVLRAISESTDESLVQILVDYLERETDEDLLVYATKTLGQFEGSEIVAEALANLAKNNSWRVRAAAIEAIGAAVSQRSYSGSSKLPMTKLAEAVLTAAADEDPFVADRAAKLVKKVETDTTVTVIAEFLRDNPQHLPAYLDQLSPIAVWASDQDSMTKLMHDWLDRQDDVASLRVATSILAKRQPSKLTELLPNLVASNDKVTRLAALRALVSSVLDIRVEHEYEEDDLSNMSFSAWHDVPSSLDFEEYQRQLALKAAEANSERQSATSQSIKIDEELEEDLGAFENLFGPPDSSKRAADRTANIDDTSPPSTSADSTASSEKNADELLEADLLESLSNAFGESPPKRQTPATRNEATANQPEASDFEPPLNSADWLELWLSTDYQAYKDVWLTKTQAELLELESKRTDLEGPQVDEDELRWRHFGLLVSGRKEFADRVYSQLDRDTESTEEPPANLVLPWLPSSLRMRVLQETPIDWQEHLATQYSPYLYAATEINDESVADWLCDQWSESVLEKQHLAAAKRYLLRALVGEASNAILTTIYPGVPTRFYDSSQLVGEPKAVHWLTERYQQEDSPFIRATLLLTFNYLNHELAQESAIGLVSNAKQFDIEIELATCMSLAYQSKEGAFLASKWLTHPLSEVRQIALDRMLTSRDEFMDITTEMGYRVVDDESRARGFWNFEGELPLDELRQMSDSEDDAEIRADLNLLRIAAGDEIPIDDYRQSEEQLIQLAGVLAKNMRCDDAAFRVYAELAEQITDEEIAAELYTYLRPINDKRLIPIRRMLRDEWSDSILNPSLFR